MTGIELNDSSYREICDAIREQGRKDFGGNGYSRIVFTNGCFDILHSGHLKLLDECRRLAGLKGAVVVGVNTDASVGRLKGQSRPIFSDNERAQLLVHLKSVDYAITFEEDTPIKLIESLRPDLIVKGGDYKASDVVGSKISPVVIVNLEDGFSTTSIIERMKR